MREELQSIRDFLRYAVSNFTRAGLHFGHGASNAVDEAAFIILESLSLPIDDLDPWLGARLTGDERTRLQELIDARVKTRKPAAYLLNKAYIQDVPFYVDERVIVPRSFIGEILAGEPAFLPRRDHVRAILDLCTGSGCLAILAAFAYPAAEVHGSDISADALDVARRNVDDHDLGGRIFLHPGDLFAPLPSLNFDLIIANPPYVGATAMEALPPEYRAEPAVALAGGRDGLDLVRRILSEAPSRLNERGGLLCEVGTGREILEREFPKLPFFWVDTEESEGEVFYLTREEFA